MLGLAFEAVLDDLEPTDGINALRAASIRYRVALNRLPVSTTGEVRLALKRPFRDGTTHVRFTTEDFLARLAALVPRPRAHLVRYHGVYAPNFPWRSLVVRAGDAPPGRRKRRAGVHGRSGSCDHGEPESSQGESSMAAPLTWAQRLERVFGIEITVCPFCGGRLRVIAAVTDPAVLGRILAHVRREGLPRAPPLAKGN